MIDVRKLDLNLLVVFQEVFQERQISSVGERLGLSQPAVSNALARLRKSLQDELFVRTAHGMQPTPLAERLAEPVSLALAQIQAALNVEEGFAFDTSTRRLTIAMSDVGEQYFMPQLVQHFATLAPQISLATVRAGTINLKEEMEAGRVDLALGAFEKVSSALYQRRLFRQPCVLMFRQSHALAQVLAQSGGVSLPDLLAARHLMVASSERTYERINRLLEAAGVTAQFRVPHFTAVPSIVASSDLVVMVPQKLAESACQPFHLQFAASPLKLPMLQTNMFWHRRFNQDPALVWLRQVMLQLFGEPGSA